MDNKDILYSNEWCQNKTPLMEDTPENMAYQSPPEIIPIVSSNNDIDKIKEKEKEYENFQINAKRNKYHVKQPTQNTFHISTGDKWMPLIILIILIFFILIIALAVTGKKTNIDPETGLAIICSPCVVIVLICLCLKQFCCTYYNADITMINHSLVIERRSCVWRSTKIYLPGQIKEIDLYRNNSRKKRRYILDIILSNNKRKTLLVIITFLTSDEIHYFNKVVNDYIKNEMNG